MYAIRSKMTAYCLKLSASKFMASIINLFFYSIFLLEFTQALKFLLQLMDAIGNLLISWQEVWDAVGGYAYRLSVSIWKQVVSDFDYRLHPEIWKLLIADCWLHTDYLITDYWLHTDYWLLIIDYWLLIFFFIRLSGFQAVCRMAYC